jgi:hypothetical protein
MPRNLQANLQLNTASAQAAIRQLQQQAAQIGRTSGGGGGFSNSGGSGGGGGGFRIPGMPGMGGGVTGFAAGAALAALAAVGKELNDLGKRANELAQSASNSASALGQLRSATERSNISRDIAAGNPGVINFEKAKQDVSKGLTDFVAGLTGTKEERDKAAAERLKQGLGGQAGEDWRRIKESRLDMETDIETARTAMGVKYQRQERDFAFERKNWAVETARQYQDLQKQSQRQEQDYQLQKQKFDENFQSKQAAKQYEISRQFAAYNFQVSQSRNLQDFTLSQSDKRYDYSVSKSRNQYDYSVSKSRNQQDFSLNKAYAQEDRKDTLFDMALGGASGLDYLRYNRDYLKQQRRAQQQFNIGQGRNEADFTLGQGRNEADFTLGQSRDTRNFGIGMARNQQDFTQQAREAQVGRQLQIESELYARKYEGISLELQHNRALKDINIQYERLGQNVARDQEKFANQQADMTQDKNLDYAEFNRKIMRQRRDQGYTEEDFANAQRFSNPVGAVGQAAKDAEFAGALSRGGQRTGQPDLIDQYNKARQDQENSLATKIGEAVGAIIKGANKNIGDINNPNNNLFGKGPTSPRPQILDIIGGAFGWAGSQLGNISNPKNSLLGNNSSIGNTGMGKPGINGNSGSYYGGFDASNFVGASSKLGPGSGSDYMDGPAREQAGKQQSVFNVGGSNTYNINVAANPQIEEKMNMIAAKYAVQAANEMASELKRLYGG